MTKQDDDSKNQDVINRKNKVRTNSAKKKDNS